MIQLVGATRGSTGCARCGRPWYRVGPEGYECDRCGLFPREEVVPLPEEPTPRSSGSGSQATRLVQLAALGLCLDGRGYPWRSQRTGGPMTADGFYRLCRRLSHRTGIHVFPHRFRTTWACLFLEATGDVGSAQVLMGHAKVETTLRYAGWIQQRRALEQMRRHSLSDRIAGLGKELP